jgi:hypothetical protein
VRPWGSSLGPVGKPPVEGLGARTDSEGKASTGCNSIAYAHCNRCNRKNSRNLLGKPQMLLGIAVESLQLFCHQKA